MTLDERAHRAAFGALLSTPLNGHLYDFGKVPGADGNPGDLPGIYVLLSVTRRFVEPEKLCRRTDTTGWRALFRYVGLTVNEARWAGLQVVNALDGVSLTVDGVASTPLLHENTTSITKADRGFSGAAVYTYVL